MFNSFLMLFVCLPRFPAASVSLPRPSIASPPLRSTAGAAASNASAAPAAARRPQGFRAPSRCLASRPCHPPMPGHTPGVVGKFLGKHGENMGKTMGKTMELVRDSEFIENDGKAMEKSHGKIPWKTPGVISTLDPNINHIIHLIPPFMFLRMAFGEVEPPFNRSNLRPRSFMSSTSCRLSCCSKVSPAWAL